MKLNKEVRHYFKLWQEALNVYQEINIDDVEFELVSLSDKSKFEFKSGIGAYVKAYLDNNPGEVPVCTGTNKNEGIGYHVKPRSENDLIFSKSVTFNKNGESKAFFRDYPYLMNRDHIAIIPDDNEFNAKFLYYQMAMYFNENLFGWGENTVSVDIVKKHNVIKPKNESSKIQTILVEFIEYYESKFEQYRHLISSLTEKVKFFDKAFLPAVFSAEKDPFIEEHFDQWSIRKQLSIKFNDINFERSVLKECCSFPPLSRVKGKADLSIQEYESLGDQEQMQYFPLISGTMLNNQITGYLHKDRLSANSLSPSPVLSWTRINASQFFIQNNPVVTNDDSFILVPNNSEKIKFIYYSILAEMSKSQFSWTNKAGKEKVKNISIYSLSDSYCSSAIVEFIDEWHNWRDEIFRRIDQLRTSIDQAEEALIAKTFKGCEE